MIAVDDLLLGESIRIRQLREIVKRVAPSSLPVLIQGPTGSGKELVALAIHAASGRRGHFVPFNVCAIADSMFEDTLFGHVRGAFTGALADSAGLLAQADRGTCFFDEISGLALPLQAKLLRAIESRQFRPVGAPADTRSDFRVVAASNEDLRTLKDRGKFREDLLHRFGKVIVTVPSLQERIEDVPFLARHFLHQTGGVARRIAPAAEQRLMAYAWPGNVRELRSVIETAAVLANHDVVGVGDVAPLLRADESGSASSLRADLVLHRTVAAIIEAQGNVHAAAEALGVNPTTVYRRLRRARLPVALFGSGVVAFYGATSLPGGAAEGHTGDAVRRQPSA